MGGGEHGHGHGHHVKIYHNPVINHYIDEPHHPGAEFKAPDWKQYKVSNAPKLKDVEERLARKGLKDPWLRNHVWRFDPQFGSVDPVRLSFKSWGRGFKNGFVLAVGVILLQTAYGKIFGSNDHHGHGHGNGHADKHH